MNRTKKQYLVNLNTIIDQIQNLVDVGELDEKAASIIIKALYLARDRRLTKNPYKVLEIEDKQVVLNFAEYLEINIEALARLFLQVEAAAHRNIPILDTDKNDKFIQRYFEGSLDKIASQILMIREKFIAISNCTDKNEMLEIINQRSNI